MFLPRLFVRQDVRSTRRSRTGRRPLVDEPRRASAPVSFSIAKVAAVVSSNQVGTPATPKKTIETPAIQGQHIGSPAIQGNHIGTPAASGKHLDFAAPAIQGNHIGFQVIPVDYNGSGVVPAGCQGCHIGYQ